MSSPHINEWITDYIDGTLSPGQAEKVRSHLVFCNACRHALDETQKNVRALRSTPAAPVPAGLEARILMAVRREAEAAAEGRAEAPERAPHRERNWFSFGALGLMAASLLVALLLRDLPKRRAEIEQTAANAVAPQAVPPIPAQQAQDEERASHLEAAAPATAPARDGAVATDKQQAFAPLQEQAEKRVAPVPPLAPAARTAESAAFSDRLASKDLAVPPQKLDRGAMRRPPAPAADAKSEEAPVALKKAAPAASLGEFQAKTSERRIGLAAKPANAPAEPSAPHIALRDGAAANATAGAPAAAFSGAVPAEKMKATAGGDVGQTFAGFSSGLKSPVERIISNEADWAALWREHQGSGPPPAVDFSRQQVVVLAAGEKPSGGYAIVWQGLEPTTWDGQSARVVRYAVTEPPAGAAVSTAVTQPYLFRVIPRAEGPVFFRKSP